jgi:hypothetical protein
LTAFGRLICALRFHQVLKTEWKGNENSLEEGIVRENQLKGIIMPDKPLILSCLKILQTESIDLVDA